MLLDSLLIGWLIQLGRRRQPMLPDTSGMLTTPIGKNLVKSIYCQFNLFRYTTAQYPYRKETILAEWTSRPFKQQQQQKCLKLFCR